MKPLLSLCLAATAFPFSIQANDIIPGRFIVQLSSRVKPETVAKAYNLKPKFIYHKAINGFAASIPELARTNLLKDLRVLNIEPDKIVRANQLESEFALAWGLDRIDQRVLPLNSEYNYSANGTGVTAYVIDTGIRYDHTEFNGRASFGFDVYGGDGSDCHGHGTHVAGTIGGATFGVAKNVTLKAVKVLDCNGSGSASGIIAGVDWVIRQGKLPAVANLSLGMNSTSEAVDTAVKKMIFAGVATAIAAGNNNKDACGQSPARVPDAMTIGASSASDGRASFSNYGSCVDWFAPGVSVESAGHDSPTATRVFSGTSMATPHTAGVAALYLQMHSSAAPIQVRDALLGFSTKGIVTSANSANNHLLFSFEANNGSGDFISPLTSVTSPSNNGTVIRGSRVTLRASATDNVGVRSVKFYVNGALKCTDSTSPFTCSWRVPFFTFSSQSIETIASDAYGNVKSSRPITVRVL